MGLSGESSFEFELQHNREMEKRTTVANGSPYVLRELAASLKAIPLDPRLGPEIREDNRLKRARKAAAALVAMSSGAVHVGSATPTDFPQWVTLEVAKGGFATGKCAAQLTSADEPNENFLHPEAMARLHRGVVEGTLRAVQPEHCALPVFVYLLLEGYVEPALRVLRVFQPYMGVLRLYPEEGHPAQPSPPPDSVLFAPMCSGDLQAALEGDGRRSTSDAVRAVRTRKQQLRAPALWDLKKSVADLLTSFTHGLRVECRNNVVTDCRFDVAAAQRNVEVCHDMLRNVRGADWQYNSRMLRRSTLKIFVKALESIVKKNGMSNRELRLLCVSLIDFYKRKKPVHPDITPSESSSGLSELLKRISALCTRADTGMTEADAAAAVDGLKLSGRLAHLVSKSTLRPLSDHIVSGNIPSLDVLGDAAADICTACSAAAAHDPASRNLTAMMHRTFRNVRSLLLRGLATQKTVADIPWFRELQSVVDERAHRMPTEARERNAAVTILKTMLAHFPESVADPSNTFISAISAVLRTSGFPVPLKQIAVDIFENEFSASFTKAWKEACRLLDGTLYASYYDVEPSLSTMDLLSVCHLIARPQRRSYTADSGVVLQAMEEQTGGRGMVSLFHTARVEVGVADAAAAFRQVLRLLAQQRPTGDHRALLKLYAHVGSAWRSTLLLSALAGVMNRDSSPFVAALRAELAAYEPTDEVELMFIQPLLEKSQVRVRGWKNTSGDHLLHSIPQLIPATPCWDKHMRALAPSLRAITSELEIMGEGAPFLAQVRARMQEYTKA